MMDMFTIILVFLLKNFATEGTIVTPAENLTLPKSTVEKRARETLSVKVSRSTIVVEDKLVVDESAYATILASDDFLIEPLHGVLNKYAEEAKEAAKMFGKSFSGDISIQGDVEIPYKVLTRIMYTCGQAGYPNMNLFVYRND